MDPMMLMQQLAGVGGPEPMLEAPADLEPELSEAEADQLEQERLAALQIEWVARIKAEEKAHRGFRARGREVNRMTRPVVKKGGHHQIVPNYWQVIQVEHVGVYSSQPVPDCRPRNDERSPVFRQASDILERAIAYCVDHQSFDDNFHRAVDDFLMVGLGICRVKMEAVVTDDQIGDQMLKWDYIPWQRFGWEPCNHWRQCDYIYIRHPMTRDQIRDRFGRDVAASRDEHGESRDRDKDTETWDIYEVWDRKDRKVLFIAKGEITPLELNDDPLGLEGFFPLPYPMMTNLDDEEIIPKPDYDYIQFFDIEINRLQERRASIMESMKVAGAYDPALAELADMFELEDGEYQPVPQMTQRMAAAGGAEGIIYHLPLAEKMAIIEGLTQQIGVLRGQIDEILGISDIVRGTTNAAETATAQEIKGRWVGIRLSRKREVVQYTIREMFRIMGQLLSTHFTAENLQRLTQVQASPETLQLLQSDLMMDFSIDIESESTVAKDEFQERETRQQMLASAAAYSQAVMPLVQAGQMPADVSSALLMAALQPYTRYSRGLDEALGSLPTNQQQLQQITQQLQQAQQQLQQTQQQLQQWQQVAQTLQTQYTQAKSQQAISDAGKKQAETQKIYAEMGDSNTPGNLEIIERVADIDVKRAQALKYRSDAEKPGGRGPGS